MLLDILEDTNRPRTPWKTKPSDGSPKEREGTIKGTDTPPEKVESPNMACCKIHAAIHRTLHVDETHV